MLCNMSLIELFTTCFCRKKNDKLTNSVRSLKDPKGVHLSRSLYYSRYLLYRRKMCINVSKTHV